MEKYFITRYKSVHVPCHESEPKCPRFKPGGCAWVSKAEKGNRQFCWFEQGASRTGPPSDHRIRPIWELSKVSGGCPYFLNCRCELRYCDKPILSTYAAKYGGYACEQNIVQMPWYRLFIGEFNEAELEVFLTASGIEDHTDFGLASERELIADPNNKEEHAELLLQYSRFVHENKAHFATSKSPDCERINHYEQAAKTAKRHVILQSLADARKASPPLENRAGTGQEKPKKRRLQNENRDRRIYDLALNEKLTWGDIAETVGSEFNEILNPDQVAKAAGRYQEKNNLTPIPARSPGRKS